MASSSHLGTAIKTPFLEKQSLGDKREYGSLQRSAGVGGQVGQSIHQPLLAHATEVVVLLLLVFHS